MNTGKQNIVIIAIIFLIAVACMLFNNQVEAKESSISKSYEISSFELYTNAQNYLAGDKIVNHQSGQVFFEMVGFQLEIELLFDNSPLFEDLHFIGEIYTVNGKGYFDDKLILGEFNENEEYNIVLFKVLNENQPVLSLLLESKKEGLLLRFEWILSREDFNSWFDTAKQTTSKYEADIVKAYQDDETRKTMMLQKTASLLQPGSKYCSDVNKEYTRDQSAKDYKSTGGSTGYSASAQTIATFLTSINNSPNTGITPSTTMQQILSQTGWKMFQTEYSHFYVMHTTVNSSYEYLISLTLVSISYYVPSATSKSMGLYVVGSSSFSYNPVTKVAELLYYDTGIRMDNVTVAIELVEGTTNFYAANKAGALGGNGAGFQDVFLAILSELGVPTALWSALRTSNISTSYVDFGSDSTQQLMYGGLVGAVANKTASGYSLWGYGDYLSITGYHYNSSEKVYSSNRIAWAVTAHKFF